MAFNSFAVRIMISCSVSLQSNNRRSLEAKKAKADAKAAEEAKKAEAEAVLKKLLASGMSADEILEKLK